MNSRFWSNHYLSTIAWWIVLVLFIKDYNHCSGGFTSILVKDIFLDIELTILLILTFIRGLNYNKFKQRQKNIKG